MFILNIPDVLFLGMYGNDFTYNSTNMYLQTETDNWIQLAAVQ